VGGGRKEGKGRQVGEEGMG
jgi:hypothetical protein